MKISGSPLSSVPRRSAAVLLVAAGLFLTGCGTASVSTDELERTVSDSLEKSVGKKPEQIDCPNKLKAEVGATTRCTLSDSGKKYGITVTVKSVDNGNAKYDVKVDDKPMQ